MSPATATRQPTMNPALKDFWAQQSRFKVLYGGRGSSKSWDAAANSARVSRTIPARILCTRMYQNRIEESVYTTIKKQIRRFNLDHEFRILNNKIIHRETGAEYLFYGLARNIDEIKSLEGVDILWIEEAHALTEEMWELIEPTIRKEHSEIWVIFNPNLSTDFAWKRFVEHPPPNSVVRKINYDENPFLSSTLRETIQNLKETDYDSYEHIYLGVPKEDDESTIIKRSWLEAAVDAHKQLDIEVAGRRMVGYDPADGNQEGTADENAYAKRYGILLEDIQQWIAGEDELFKSCKRVFKSAIESESEVIYDSVGVGAGCGSNFIQIGEQRKQRITYYPFNAGGKVVNPDKEYKPKVKNKDHFSNVKAQLWWTIRDRLLDTYNAVTKGQAVKEENIISISSECSYLEELITELSTPRKDYDSAGRIRVERKKDMLNRGIESPNLADAAVMSFAEQFVEQPKGSLSPQKITF